MKLLAIVGSPRTNGNTYREVLRVIKRVNERIPDAQCEIIQLSELALQPCKGCFVCIPKGEGRCPLRDGRAELERKMMEADGVIFASPVYTYNVSWTMKNLFDRFAYRCHRPEFVGKKAMVLATTGAVGLGFVKGLLSFTIGTMGFATCAKVGRTIPPVYEENTKREAKELRALERQTDRFVAQLQSNRLPRPTLFKLLQFRFQKRAFSAAPKDCADYAYWSEKGWLDGKTRYYYPVGFAAEKGTPVQVQDRLIHGQK